MSINQPVNRESSLKRKSAAWEALVQKWKECRYSLFAIRNRSNRNLYWVKTTNIVWNHAVLLFVNFMQDISSNVTEFSSILTNTQEGFGAETRAANADRFKCPITNYKHGKSWGYFRFSVIRAGGGGDQNLFCPVQHVHRETIARIYLVYFYRTHECTLALKFQLAPDFLGIY